MPATSSNCCKSAKPQMLSVTQKSTLSQQQQPRQNHQTNPPQSVHLPFPFPFSSPRGAARTRCRRQSSSICLPSIMAAHCGITELPDASCNEGVLPTADCRLWAIANKKGGKSTLLWHLILILLPYLSIDSGDCRCVGQIHFVL